MRKDSQVFHVEHLAMRRRGRIKFEEARWEGVERRPYQTPYAGNVE